MPLIPYCKLCESEIKKMVFTCPICDGMKMCTDCVGKARSYGDPGSTKYRDFLCPVCNEVLYLQLNISSCSLERQRIAELKNNPEFSKEAVYSPAAKDSRFHPNSRRTQRCKKTNKENDKK